MKPTVYVETTIVSYLTSRPSRDLIIAGRQALTSEWWATCQAHFDLYVSPLVVAEAEDGDPDAANRRMQSIKGIPALLVTDEARSLARLLVHRGPIPESFVEDALHVAICAIHGVDYLVTWNCTHLANAQIRRQVERVVEKAGYRCPIICTPEELMEE